MKKMEFSNHPDPSFARENWQDLNGVWDFAFDRDNTYEKTLEIPFDRTIRVPYCYQCGESGIGEKELCENVWYRRRFTAAPAGHTLLHIGACDNTCKAYVNGRFAGSHTGGYTPFTLDITDYLRSGENELIVKAEDGLSKHIPRGKQAWKGESVLCWYENSTGIWQNVWLEAVGEEYLTGVRLTPDVDSNSVRLEAELSAHKRAEFLDVTFRLHGKTLASLTERVLSGRVRLGHTFEEYGAEAVLDFFWSDQNPNLIDVDLTLRAGDETLDSVHTYFGMRKISVSRGRVYLNDQPLYQRLVLFQGYYPNSLLTPKSLEELRADIALMKEMGFNGARMHQKIEDPRFYYLADKLGFLVWGELPSCYAFSDESRKAMIATMTEFVRRDYNHPCIINWVTVNESWGVHRITASKEQQDFARALYYLVKSMDPTRLVSSNDGWEQIAENDICGIHDYTLGDDAEEKLADLDFLLNANAQFKAVYAEGAAYNGVPVMITEYGGIKLAADSGWGYNGSAKSVAEYLNRLRVITEGILKNKRICGYCYTQFTDVFQETNGLADENRHSKADVKELRKIFGKNR